MSDVLLDGYQLLDGLVRLVSVEYIFYGSLHSFMTYGRSVKEFLFISYFLFLINCQRSLSAALFRIRSQSSLPDRYRYRYSVDGLQSEEMMIYIKRRGVT